MGNCATCCKDQGENTMKTRAILVGTVTGIMQAATALAASGAREDDSGIASSIFLVLCALIIVAQLIPVGLMILGFTRGMRKEAKKEEAK